MRLRGGGTIGAGTAFEADEEIHLGRRTQKFTATSTITEYDPPHVISWTSMPPGRPRPRRIQWWYRLEPAGAGTRVTERVEVDLSPVLNVLMKLPYNRLRGAAVRSGMARTLENLERTLASSPAARHRATADGDRNVAVRLSRCVQQRGGALAEGADQGRGGDCAAGWGRGAGRTRGDPAGNDALAKNADGLLGVLEEPAEVPGMAWGETGQQWPGDSVPVPRRRN